ncbi:hypothetical protein SAMN02799624_04479 [Paenibacillus sp. UNC496MF]|uniref:hypothetical protein n=1 Tax=Paenibacillus sp. UNC496MF TaxID=1502753 RepID=UPI0008DEE387|nr:hypothetical protein [Paenibacillus sp. UNC496MF]SFJ43195.1 hypothetical protein SAMN02799624_04479 [Paenibacillus sp. UNC496MF]
MPATRAGERELCKGCGASVHATEEQIERVLGKLALHPGDCVDDGRYGARLDQCASCPSLQYGTTCAHCGCFVRVRAKLAAKDCPRPGGSLWG